MAGNTTILKVRDGDTLHATVEQQLQQLNAPTGEIRDLVSLVTTSLVKSNVPTVIIDEFNNDPYILRLRDKPEVTQRYVITQYFNMWFVGFIDFDTRVYRAGLIRDGSIEEWLSALEEIVIPGIRIISHKLGVEPNLELPDGK